MVDNFQVTLGVSGLPRAKPLFGEDSQDYIRHKAICCGTPPGPRVPFLWLEAGDGWVTKYFTDVVPLDRDAKQLGRYRCQVRLPDGQQCPYEIQDEQACCMCGPCWSVNTVVPAMMMTHVQMQHGIMDPGVPLREWSTGLCDTDGCCEALFCAPCNGSRQMMALSGHEDTFSWAWCLFFTLLGCRTERSGDQTVVYWVPPHFYVALLTRFRMVKLNSINEGCCCTALTISFCALCSVAQTNRELTHAGVWPGSSCGSDRPAYYGSKDLMPMIKPSATMA